MPALSSNWNKEEGDDDDEYIHLNKFQALL